MPTKKVHEVVRQFLAELGFDSGHVGHVEIAWPVIKIDHARLREDGHPVGMVRGPDGRKTGGIAVGHTEIDMEADATPKAVD